MNAPTLYTCRCDCGCKTETEAPIPMGHLFRNSGPCVTLYVCANCVHHMTPRPLTGELTPPRGERL
ncbi:hypothetical protein [Streptomyces bluensis]|uniref:hypothetical protein n=1 Tax=Streptomyces bluensis TaxID=33897 RepID=UPI003318881E